MNIGTGFISSFEVVKKKIILHGTSSKVSVSRRLQKEWTRIRGRNYHWSQDIEFQICKTFCRKICLWSTKGRSDVPLLKPVECLCNGSLMVRGYWKCVKVEVFSGQAHVFGPSSVYTLILHLWVMAPKTVTQVNWRNFTYTDNIVLLRRDFYSKVIITCLENQFELKYQDSTKYLYLLRY